MNVYFLRHAEAEEEAQDDFDRKLTAKGVEQAERAAKFLTKASLAPALILTSPVVRAKQTAEIVRKKFPKAGFAVADWLACGMALESCLANLEACGESEILLVGHEPDFSECISAWAGCSTGSGLHIRKCSLTGLDVRSFSRGGARIEFLVPARIM